MSRSRKKPYFQIGHKPLKKICSRNHRRTARQILKPWTYKYRDCWGYGCEEDRCWAPWNDNEYEYGYCGFLCNCYQFIAPMEPSFPTRFELMNPYDICDQRGYWPEEPKSYRK